MNNKTMKYQTKVENRTFYVETGKLAPQAGGAVTIQLGDTMVFAAATMSSEQREGVNFIPLVVNYEERLYAGGKIPGSYFRREGRPHEEATLTARLTDRCLRPLFPKDLFNDIQVIQYSLSTDEENPIDILAVNAASAALMISDVPWGGPIGAIRVGRIEGEYVTNPTFDELEYSDLDLRLAGTKDAILMVECGAQEMSEEVVQEALIYGHNAIQPMIDLQEQMASEIGKSKSSYATTSTDETLYKKVQDQASISLDNILDQQHDKTQRNNAVDELRQSLITEFTSEDESLETTVKSAFSDTYKNTIRMRILDQGTRLDGRKSTDVRPIWCETDVSPRAHGSGTFTRGETQVLTLATLGTPREAQELDNLTPSDSKRYIHHYNFPPFSTGETRFLRGASRREIGHGALAERALRIVIPPDTEFPYTMRLVSEVLSSNGSSSMASVCGSTLALMDTGVPIKSPVAGVAMGLVIEEDRYSILTDILGIEDHLGDMDFKVAGTKKGITALQMDIKISGVTKEIMSEALEQAKVARLHILEKIIETIEKPRPELKSHVPRITIVKIPVEKIGAIIGPGGKTIRAIQEETETTIDINEDGSVYIAATDGESSRRAVEKVESLTESPVIGRIYTGKVVRTTNYGAFIEILPNTDGMVHISQLDSERINKVEDVAKVGDEITVMVTNIDHQGKIRLSRQAVLEGWTAEEAQRRDRPRSKKGSRNKRRSSGYNKKRR